MEEFAALAARIESAADADEAFRVAEAIAEQRNHSDSSDGETVSDSEASDQ